MYHKRSELKNMNQEYQKTDENIIVQTKVH